MNFKRGALIVNETNKHDILDDYAKRISMNNEKSFTNKIQFNGGGYNGGGYSGGGYNGGDYNGGNYNGSSYGGGGYNGGKSIGKSVSGQFYDKANVKIEEKSDTSRPLQGQSRLIALEKMHQISPVEIFQEDTGMLLVNSDIQFVKKSNVLNPNTKKSNAEYKSNRIVNQPDTITELDSQTQLVQNTDLEKREDQNLSFHGVGQASEDNFESDLGRKKSMNISNESNKHQNNVYPIKDDESKLLGEKSFTKQQANDPKKIENSTSDFVKESTFLFDILLLNSIIYRINIRKP